MMGNKFDLNGKGARLGERRRSESEREREHISLKFYDSKLYLCFGHIFCRSVALSVPWLSTVGCRVVGANSNILYT